jgi:hypothetical protein
MREPHEVAQSWYAKAAEQPDVFDRFVALWFAFNALYNKSFPTPDSSERQAIDAFVFDPANRLDGRTMDRVLGSPEVRSFRQRTIRDVRGGARDPAEDAIILGSRDRGPRRRLKALFMILYQVRCNLFHGNKMYGRDTDHEIVQNAANILMEVVRCYLGDRAS